MATQKNPNRPQYARCDACGRNAWKVAVRYPNRNHTPTHHPTAGYCPSCFDGCNQERLAAAGGRMVADLRGAASQARTPVLAALLPQAAPADEPTATSPTGRRVWAACGHAAERDAMDCCYTCRRPLVTQ